MKSIAMQLSRMNWMAAIFGAVLGLCAVTGAAAPDDETDAVPTSELRVVVSQVAGTESTPCEGATVVVSSPSAENEKATTDRDGEALFRALPYGTATISVSVSGAGSKSQKIDLDREKILTEINFPAPTGKLTLWILGEADGEAIPISGCKIEIEDESGTIHKLPRTDADGSVTAGHLTYGKLEVVAIATGWETTKEMLTLDEEKAELKIVLSPLTED